MIGLWHWILTVTGANNVSGAWYGFWSGFAGDLGIFAAIGIFYRKHICHAAGCFRFGLHMVEGTPYITCRKHHPDTPKKVSVSHIHLMHKKAKEKK